MSGRPLRRVAPWLAVAAGVFLLGLAVGCGGFSVLMAAGLPGPDDPPAQQVEQDRRVADGGTALLAGLGLTAAGVLALVAVGGWVVLNSHRSGGRRV